MLALRHLSCQKINRKCVLSWKWVFLSFTKPFCPRHFKSWYSFWCSIFRAYEDSLWWHLGKSQDKSSSVLPQDTFSHRACHIILTIDWLFELIRFSTDRVAIFSYVTCFKALHCDRCPGEWCNSINKCDLYDWFSVGLDDLGCYLIADVWLYDVELAVDLAALFACSK